MASVKTWPLWGHMGVKMTPASFESASFSVAKKCLLRHLCTHNTTKISIKQKPNKNRDQQHLERIGFCGLYNKKLPFVYIYQSSALICYCCKVILVVGICFSPHGCCVSQSECIACPLAQKKVFVSRSWTVFRLLKRKSGRYYRLICTS